MDYKKLSSFVATLRREETNLQKEEQNLSRQLSGIRMKIKKGKEIGQLLSYINQCCFLSAVEGKDHATIFITTVSFSESGAVLWPTIQEAHTSIDRILCEVGVKDFSIESIDQFRSRNPSEIISSSEYDTVISFPLSQN